MKEPFDRAAHCRRIAASGGKSKSAKKLKACYRSCRKALLTFRKKYPGKTIHDFAPPRYTAE